MEPKWSSRNVIFKDYDIENKSILDFGCGDKSICNYLNFSTYIGYDTNPRADYQIDFNKDFKINEKGDVGLVLGVLEYLDDPDTFIETIKSSCNRFIIMILAVKAPKIDQGWKRVYNEDTFNIFLNAHFETYILKKVNKYIIADIKI